MFGEVGLVLDQCKCNTIKGKIENRGKTCMFTGYAEDHASEVYRMLNLETNCLLKTRDVLWFNKVYGTYTKGDPIPVIHLMDVDRDLPELVQSGPGRDPPLLKLHQKCPIP
jgi:hypothetical protein